MHPIWIVIIIVITLLVLGALFYQLAASRAFFIAKTVTVNGEASVASEPDETTVDLGNTGPTDIMPTILKNLQSKYSWLEPKHFSTVEFYTRPATDEELKKNPNQKTFVTYRVQITLKPPYNHQNIVSEMITLAKQQGANQIGNVQFRLSNEKIAFLQNQALKKAMEDAQTKANVIATAANMTLGPATLVTNVSSLPFMKNTQARAFTNDIDQDATTIFAPTKKDTTASIQVTFSMR